MKQLLFMAAATMLGTVGVFVVSPFCGVAVYYLFAVLRPQYLWAWVLPPDVAWSQYVGAAAMVGAAATLAGFAPAIGGGASYERGGSAPVRLSFAHRAVVALALWISVAHLAALDRDVSYPWFLEYMKIFAMFLASAVVMTRVTQLWTLLLIAALSIGYIAYEVNFIYVFQNALPIFHEGYGGLDNNGAGLMLAMGVPLCVFAWEGSTRVWRWSFAALIPVIVHAVLMTYSRGAMLALLVASPLIFLRSRHRRHLWIAALVLLAIVPVLAGPEIRARFFSIQQYEIDRGAQSRFSSWAAAWHMAQERPIFGMGLRNADLYSRDYGADLSGRTIHSQYLQIGADTGLIGLGLYLLVLCAVWRALIRAQHQARSDLQADPGSQEARRAHAVAAGAECGLAVFCVGGLFLSLEVFELPYLLLLLGAQLSLVFQPLAHRANASVTVPVRRSVPTRVPAVRAANALQSR